MLTISASDRAGLLYRVARVLANHKVNIQLAKISTLGERVEDTFLVTGPSLRQDKVQLEIRRGDKLQTISLQLEVTPKASPAAGAKP